MNVGLIVGGGVRSASCIFIFVFFLDGLEWRGEEFVSVNGIHSEDVEHNGVAVVQQSFGSE